MKAEVTRMGVFGMQVCVPKDWTDERVTKFAETENPSGTTSGWQIRREGSELLKGMPERGQCEERENFVHIVLDV